ncbi:cysteine desulfurase [Flavobacterium cyanobacteriorum]|uniref:cysteine desulfurase n=1 Tax=Flavobacterium cyanobacteriorum TaxID=2022802 RepID=A0A255ZTY0_9FLAO|nr:cysteine desulfurase family protein [Flavobacterium cyanobacteriorum]OYQ44365.1 cysteine desulfurase [Flavobacterium cyanobacteriorum]
MKRVYLDNASTTVIRPEVIAEMARIMSETYGNPSSTHSFGRSAKVVLETARKTIAGLIGAEAREIVFTSGGTEADNWIIRSAVKDLKVKRIITSRAEHHAVLNAVEAIAAEYDIKADYVHISATGAVDMEHLEVLLQEDVYTLVCLMHVNNETGVVLDLKATGQLCHSHNALFMSDTVQAIGKEMFNIQELPVDFIVASAHKFHGPKGVGFAFVRKNIPLKQLLYGGEQEKGFRAGTEAVHQVAGMAKALEMACAGLAAEKAYVTGLREYLIDSLNAAFPGYKINGAGSSLFYNIINVMLPLPEEKTAMILFHLDMKGIAVSRGSACQSGSIKPSHVLSEMLSGEDLRKPSLRISLSHNNTREDIDLFIEALKSV